MTSRYSLTLALACASFAASAPARATVQIYGALDSFLMYSRNSGQQNLQLLSGGASTSRWGFTGTEDLGGGMRAAFRLESGFDLMSGRPQSSSAFYNREANVSLSSTEWGTLKLGKQYPAIGPEGIDPFYSVGQLSPYATSALVVSDLGPGAASIQARVDNAVSYETPDLAGLSATVLYASRNVAGASPNASNIGTVVNYGHGPLMLSGSYNAVWAATSTVPGGAPNGPRTDAYMLSATYQFGETMGSLSYVLNRPNGPGTFNAQVYSLGLVWQRGPHVVRFGAIYRNVAGKFDHALGALLGYDYQFSKLTGVYARVGGFRNYGQSTLSFGADPLGVPGINPVVFALGFRQKF
ncbi:porin [Pandoraea fibrosis]|uniref:Outer membrane porin protein n=1 Tax=Pandoraea fibrosis TaxID=1891094 RepID=A0A5E4TJB2_9BURK|nr:porin [Pandoraea fibrosis]VVD88096.1 Outer membrane porin protein [Pandoraea fibrosis]